MRNAPIDLPLGTDAAIHPFPHSGTGTNRDDMILIQACQNGEAGAFEQLVKRYDRRLLRIAQHVTHNLEDAQDAVQMAFLKIFRRSTQFQEEWNLSTWLIRITVNESLLKQRKRRSIKETPVDLNIYGEEASSPIEVVDSTHNLEERYQGSEVQYLLRSALQKLHPAARVVFVLRDVEGLTTEETAEVLALTQSAVKARLWRARLELRERLSKYFVSQRSLISAPQRACSPVHQGF
jgi:RNA polymerase sigma-70 factor (ECF subfamily)